MCKGPIASRKAVPTKNEPRATKVFDLRTPFEYVNFVLGVVILVVTGLPLAVCLTSATLWEGLDRGFDGGLTQSGKEQTGLILGRLAPGLKRVTQKYTEQISRRPENGFVVLAIAFYGLVIPAMFVYTGWVVRTGSFGTGLLAMYVYNVIRTGPFFMNFAYVYTLSHKEAHTHVGLYKKEYMNAVSAKIFNWWIGLFYGITPGAFHYGHVQNHHIYNNEELDCHSVGDKPRDSFVNFICYLPRWFLYASNISTTRVIAFHDKNYAIAKKMVYSVLYYIFLLWTCWTLGGPAFTLGCAIYPFFESLVLLAAVNWVWHGMMDPADPLNEFSVSPTFIDGPVNVLNEDMHVVHHQYPGQNWKEHPNLVAKHAEAYQTNVATVFWHTHVFEVFGMMMMRDYDTLAKHFVDLRVLDVEEVLPCLSGRTYCNQHGVEKKLLLSAFDKLERACADPGHHQAMVVLVQERLRACCWGPRVREVAKTS